MKKILRVIAVLVSIAMFFQELPVITTKAARENQPDLQQEAEEPKEEAGEAEILEELIEKRTETEKYFLMSDGTFQVARYAQPVHYKDSDGYTEINNELVEATDAQGDTVYKNTESDFHVAFAKKADSKKLVTVTYEDHEISWGFVLEGQGRKGKKQPFSKPGKSRKASAKSENPLENTGIADAGSYVDLYPGVDVTYELVSKQLKENIILRNKKAAGQALVMEVRHPGLTAEKTPEGGISLADEAGRQI